MQCISAVTPTICQLMGVQRPATSQAEGIDAVCAAAKASLGEGKLDRVMLYAPDCIGTQLIKRYQSSFQSVYRIAPTAVPLRAAFPPKTPVCFGTMLSGTQPAVHGIKEYVRPVLKVATIFDAMIAAGKRCAIVAVPDCSMAKIFRERKMDYFTEADDEAVMLKTLELLQTRDEWDFMVCYQIGYDKLGHRTGPYSEASIAQMNEKIANFGRLFEGVQKAWSDHRWMLTFSPDHGSHVDPTSGKADHCWDIPHDMDLHHFFGFGGKPAQ